MTVRFVESVPEFLPGRPTYLGSAADGQRYSPSCAATVPPRGRYYIGPWLRLVAGDRVVRPGAEFERAYGGYLVYPRRRLYAVAREPDGSHILSRPDGEALSADQRLRVVAVEDDPLGVAMLDACCRDAEDDLSRMAYRDYAADRGRDGNVFLRLIVHI